MRPELWEHVQRALDLRRDPREDERVQAELIAEPEALLELQELLDALETLPHAPPVARRRRVAAVAAASLVAVVATGFFIELRVQRAPSAPPARTPERGRVISVEWEVGSETPEHSSTFVVTERGSRSRCESRDASRCTTWTTESTRAFYP